MKKSTSAILIVLLMPAFCFSQTLPRLENDTLYATCGYKIYKGQILQFAKGTAGGGKFRFVKIYSDGKHITNCRVLVKKLEKVIVSALGNEYIKLEGSVLYKDGTTDKIELSVNFDKAIEGYPGLCCELSVPDEFRNKAATNQLDQIKKLKGLLDDKAITQEEYDSLKKSLLSNHN
jgi:hypothetical protein